MNPGHHHIERSLEPAPAGRRVRVTGWLIVALLCAILIGGAIAASTASAKEAWSGLALLSAVVLLNFGIWITSRIREYRVSGGELVIDRFLIPVRFPLDGLVEAMPDSEPLQGAWRTCGNSGLGSVCGRFRSSRLGKFRVYASDVEKAIVLRWPDRTVVVSPDSHYQFLEAMKPYLR